MTETDQFEAFMMAYQNLVYSTALRLLGRESDAEDVAQEAFLRAYEHFGTLRQSTTPGGWLKTVTRNLCLNHLTRYRARWRFFSELSMEDEDDDFAASLPAEDAADSRREAADTRQLLEQALQRLPTAQRVPLVLYHFEDLSYEDIADKLGISLSKVKTDIHRGRTALRKKISRQEHCDVELQKPPIHMNPAPAAAPLTTPKAC